MVKEQNVAVILAGAVAKAAFEAGALSVLAETGVRVVRIVAASSGALNGVAYAAAVRARRERDAAAELLALWRDHATWAEIVHLDWRELWHREAFSDLTHVRALLRRSIQPAQGADPAPINLRIVLSPLDGTAGDIAGHPATTYERMVQFDGPSFDSAERLDDVFTAVLASSSFPLVFAPTDVPGVGRCIDGGAVNNTPIGWALDDALGQTLDAVIVISPTVEQVPGPIGDLHGADYLAHLIDMLINERLYRDLREAEKRNAAMRALDALGPDVIAPAALARVRSALGLDTTRAIPIVQIRPLERLPGTSFSAFRDADQRAAYIEAGAARARAVLGPLGWI